MGVEREINDETHRVLSEEVDGYDPEEAKRSIERWVKRSPPPEPPGDDEPTDPEVEADGGSERRTD